MKIAITGITGFLGNRLAGALAGRGHKVLGLSRNIAAAQRLLGDRYEYASWPTWSHPLEPGTFDGVDAIIHLAGESVSGRWTRAKRAQIMDSRRVGTSKIVEAIATAKTAPRQLISSSAIGYYGDCGETVLTEASAAGDIFLSDVCIAWEEEAMKAVRHGTQVTLLRTGLVLHPHGGALGEMLPLFRRGLGGKLGSGRQYWSWIHIDDWIASVCFVLERRLEGPFNLVGPAPVTQRDFAKTLATVLRRPSFLPAPAFALRAVLGDFASEVLTSKRVLPARLEEEGFSFRYSALRDALTHLLDA